MKIWNSYASEHSANLVMIGRFKDAQRAEEVKDIFDSLAKAASEDERAGAIGIGMNTARFSEKMLNVLTEKRIHGLGPDDLLQFTYDINYDVKDSNIVINTDETEVSAFLKILIERGARVEVFSAHDYPEKS